MYLLPPPDAPSTGDIGPLATVLQVQGFTYLGGSLLFGIALFRAHVLNRWATVLLAVSGLLSAALSVMPDALYRLLAFPNGIAMIALGYSLWRQQRQIARQELGNALASDNAAARGPRAARARWFRLPWWPSAPSRSPPAHSGSPSSPGGGGHSLGCPLRGSAGARRSPYGQRTAFAILGATQFSTASKLLWFSPAAPTKAASGGRDAAMTRDRGQLLRRHYGSVTEPAGQPVPQEEP